MRRLWPRIGNVHTEEHAGSAVIDWLKQTQKQLMSTFQCPYCRDSLCLLSGSPSSTRLSSGTLWMRGVIRARGGIVTVLEQRKLRSRMGSGSAFVIGERYRR